MLKKIMLASAMATFVIAPAMAGGHGGGKKMQKMDCAAKLEKMAQKGMKGEKYNMAMKKLKAGDEKGCMAIVKQMKKGSKSGYGKSAY